MGHEKEKKKLLSTQAKDICVYVYGLHISSLKENVGNYCGEN